MSSTGAMLTAAAAADDDNDADAVEVIQSCYRDEDEDHLG